LSFRSSSGHHRYLPSFSTRRSSDLLARLVPAQARVLVLYGGASARKTGTLDEVMAALAGRTVTEFGGIEPNPTYETLMHAVEQRSAEHTSELQSREDLVCRLLLEKR